MKNQVLPILLLITSVIAFAGFASATLSVPQIRCGGTDLCSWSQTLPLGSPDTGCGLTYNTSWPLNTENTATCNFNGNQLENAMLYVSIDNDIVICTLNGHTVLGPISHENCAPLDPRDGYSADLSQYVTSGSNSLVCVVNDRGIMDHFDACVTGTQVPTPEVPEFGVLIGALTLVSAVGVFFVLRRK